MPSSCVPTSGSRPKRSLTERAEAAKESALAKAQRAPRPVLRIALSFLRDLMAIEPFDRAMTLAAQAFVSIFPLLITWVAFFDDGNAEVGSQVAERLHLSESVATVLDQSLPADTDASTTFGVISLLIVLVSATSLSRALGRMYAKAWHVPPSGWGDGWRWVAVIVAICAAAVTTQFLSQATEIVTRDRDSVPDLPGEHRPVRLDPLAAPDATDLRDSAAAVGRVDGHRERRALLGRKSLPAARAEDRRRALRCASAWPSPSSAGSSC